MKKTSQILFAFVALLMFNVSAFAKSEIYTGTFSSKAVGGYDTVAYFTQGTPVKGDSDYQTEYKGAKWLFSSQENLDAFLADPEKYAPQYGGYCAWAVGHNITAKGDPQQWKIIDDKLYLNYDADIQSKWLQDPEKWIVEGDKNWPGVLK